MKDDNNKFGRFSNNTRKDDDLLQDEPQNKLERFKKPLIFGLMTIVFAGCMYLIFKPSEADTAVDQIGLNDAVPQATDAGLASDKQKAYEDEMLALQNQEKQNDLTSLSDYWNTNEDVGTDPIPSANEYYGRSNENASLASYRQSQNALQSFYSTDNSYENETLRREIEDLRQQIADQRDYQPVPTVDDQMALMEKSYEMAARYLPANSSSSSDSGKDPKEKETVKEESAAPDYTTTQQPHFVGVAPARKNAVSSLYREPTDSAFLAEWNAPRNRGFYTAGSREQILLPKNSIKATVHETQTITMEGTVRLRLLEPAKSLQQTIPKGTVLTAQARIQGGRVQLKVSSVELAGNIIPVDITIYDIDGQQGLTVPYSPEMNALTEMAGNMSQQSGTSLMMTSSAGQQIAADLSRGVVQGVSGYFSKKVRTPKVTLKAGHQVFLVPKQ